MRLLHPVSFALVCSSLMALVGAPAMAQDEPAPAPEEPQMPDTPLNGDGSYEAHWSNPAFAEIAGMLTGTWKSSTSLAEYGSDDTTDTVITFAPVPLEAFPDAMYIEVSSIDNLQKPYYQAVLQFWDRSGEVHLRTLELLHDSRNDSMTAMWMYPAFFPAFTEEDVRSTLDLGLTRSGQGWAGSTACAYPTIKRGAMEMTSELRIEPGSLKTADRFYDASGKIISGPAMGSFYEFTKWHHPFTSEKVEDGVWRIMMTNVDEGRGIEVGDNVGFAYWGYLRDSGRPGYMFDSSASPGRDVLRFTAPGRLIPGLREPIMGLQAGEWVRFIIRADQGYKERPAARGAIPSWSDLIFTFQTQYVKAPPPPAAPTEPADGAGSEAGAGAKPAAGPQGPHPEAPKPEASGG